MKQWGAEKNKNEHLQIKETPQDTVKAQDIRKAQFIFTLVSWSLSK